MSHFYPDLLRHSFFRPPDWRWRRAQWLVEHGRYFKPRRDDEQTGRAVRFLRASARARRGASPRSPGGYGDIRGAVRLHEAGGTAELLVQARLLARQPTAEVARLTGIPADTIDAYEGLFFHCRASLDATDWVTRWLIGEGLAGKTESADPGVALKAFAYHGGPLVLEAVIPHLVGGKGLFDGGPDLATAHGRREQLVRLAVAAWLLPQGAATDKGLLKILPIVRERDLKHADRPPQAAVLAESVDSRLAELPSGARNGPLGARNEPLGGGEPPSLAALPEALREAA